MSIETKKLSIAFIDKSVFEFLQSISHRDLFGIFINTFKSNLDFVDCAYYHFISRDIAYGTIKDKIADSNIDIARVALRNRYIIESWLRHQAHDRWLMYEETLLSEYFDVKAYEEIGLYVAYHITETFIGWADDRDIVGILYP